MLWWQRIVSQLIFCNEFELAQMFLSNLLLIHNNYPLGWYFLLELSILLSNQVNFNFEKRNLLKVSILF
jgi:hypothetical protein